MIELLLQLVAVELEEVIQMLLVAMEGVLPEVWEKVPLEMEEKVQG